MPSENNGDFVDAEHILLEGDGAEFSQGQPQPQTPTQHFHILNRSHAVETEIVIFEGGWLSIRQHRRGKPGEANLINLRFVDPTPETSRHFAKQTAYISGSLAACGILAGILAYLSMFMTVTVPAAISLLFASGVAFSACVYRTQKHVTYFTLNGRVEIISLMATLGSFRLLRKIVPELTSIIRQWQDTSTPAAQRLRAEMRDHYRMRESNIIDESTCTEATQRILSRFA